MNEMLARVVQRIIEDPLFATAAIITILAGYSDAIRNVKRTFKTIKKQFRKPLRKTKKRRNKRRR